MISRNQRHVVSFLTFNIGWWVCFLGAKYGAPWAGPIYAIVAIALHLKIFPNPRGELLFIFAMTVLGAGTDSLLMHLGLFELRPEPVSIAPPWLIAMWTLFAMTMESMEPLRARWWILLSVSFVTGPVSYFAGEAMERLVYHRPLALSLLIHGLIWAALMPLLFVLHDRCLTWTEKPSRSTDH